MSRSDVSDHHKAPLPKAPLAATSRVAAFSFPPHPDIASITRTTCSDTPPAKRSCSSTW